MTEMVSVLPYAKEAGLLLPVLILMTVVVYAPKILALIDSWKMRKLNYLSTLNNNELLNDDIRKMLREEINNAAFERIHGLRTESAFREELCRLNGCNPKIFTWKRLRMANFYMDFGPSGITIHITWVHRFFNAISIIGIILSFVFILKSWGIYALQQTPLGFLTFLILLLGALGSMFMFIYQLAQCHHANQLIKEFEALARENNA